MCGILGYSGRNKLNLDKLRILFIENESRGNHSTGLWTDGGGMQKKALAARSFISSLAGAHKDSKIALGHTRFATTGGVSDRNAHPFQVGEKVVGIHNGMISNYMSLAKKYEAEIEVDSEAIFHLLAHDGIDKITDLVGNFSIAYTSPTDPSILYLFRHSNPCFVGKDEDGGLYFSSLEKALSMAGLYDIKTTEEHTLYAVKDGEMEEVKKINIVSAYSYPAYSNYSTGRYATQDYGHYGKAYSRNMEDFLDEDYKLPKKKAKNKVEVRELVGNTSYYDYNTRKFVAL